MNNRGFTLVELLAVIAVLAILAVLAFAAIGPMLEKAGKTSLGLEGMELVNSAKQLILEDEMYGTPTISNGLPVCFSMEYLCHVGVFTKGCAGEQKSSTGGLNYESKKDGDGYAGSVLVQYDKTKKEYTYQFWISNNKYRFGIVKREDDRPDGKSIAGVSIIGNNENNYMIIGGITSESYKNINDTNIADSGNGITYTTCGFGVDAIRTYGHLLADLSNNDGQTITTRVTYCAKHSFTSTIETSALANCQEYSPNSNCECSDESYTEEGGTVVNKYKCVNYSCNVPRNDSVLNLPTYVLK